jgi:hypothetical protein
LLRDEERRRRRRRRRVLALRLYQTARSLA